MSDQRTDRISDRWFRYLPVILWLLSGVLFVEGALAGPRMEEPLEASSAANDELQAFFAEIESAWQASDQRVLADCVHGDGVRVRFDGARQTVYSPSQAFYYFKNLFHGRRTLDFQFVRTQDLSAGDLIHGMAVWEFILDGDWQAQDVKLDFVLTREEETWRLTRLDTIR